MTKKIAVLLGLAVIIIVVGAGLLLKPTATAQSIPDGATFSQVRKLSQGKRPQCLADNQTTHAAVDKTKPVSRISSFDLLLGSRIIDMPAGYTTTTVHSFDGTTAMGTNSYTDKNQQKFVGNLKSFNYQARLDTKTNNWTLTSYVACNP